MGQITFVGGMVGDTLDGVTHRGMSALKQAESIIFPGNWVGERLLSFFGNRLIHGRDLTPDQVLEAFSRVESGVVLYAGDPRVFTGCPNHFPSAAELAKLLEANQHHVDWLPGLSFIQLAMNAAGISLEVNGEDALIVPPALLDCERSRHEFQQHAIANAILVMLWAEDAGAEAWAILKDARSSETPVFIVSRLGMSGEQVLEGKLRDLESSFAKIAMPATIIVQPCVKRQR